MVWFSKKGQKNKNKNKNWNTTALEQLYVIFSNLLILKVFLY